MEKALPGNGAFGFTRPKVFERELYNACIVLWLSRTRYRISEERVLNTPGGLVLTLCWLSMVSNEWYI